MFKMDLSVCCNNGCEAYESQQMQQNLDQLRFRQKSKFFPYSNDLKMNEDGFVLYFDVNKTIIMSDKAQYGTSSLDSFLNYLLSDTIWGRINEDSKKETRTLADWSIYSTEPSHQCPSPGLVTFTDFINKHSMLDSSIRNDFINSYSTCREKYNQLKSFLTNPDGTPMFLVPAFLELIKELNKKKVTYSVVFRTFGDDILQVVSEWNAFITRESLPTTLIIELPSRSASFYRTNNQSVMAYVSPSTNSPHLAIGNREIYDTINSLARCSSESPTALFIKDDYPFWAANGESDSSGKLFLIDKNYKVKPVFLDDYIGIDRTHIVDVRVCSDDTAEFVPVSFEESQEYLIKVNPLDIIQDVEYYIKVLKKRGIILD